MAVGAPLRPAVFLDKDGTILVDVPYNVDPARMAFAPGAGDGVRMLHRAGYALVVVSNQSGVARGLFAESQLDAVEARLRAMFEDAGARLTDFVYCPHHPEGSVGRYARACSCRKPEPGMIAGAAASNDIDLDRSWMVGDILDDVECGHRAGCRTALVDNANETEWRGGAGRTPDIVVSDLRAAALAIVDPAVPTRPHVGVRA